MNHCECFPFGSALSDAFLKMNACSIIQFIILICSSGTQQDGSVSYRFGIKACYKSISIRY